MQVLRLGEKYSKIQQSFLSLFSLHFEIKKVNIYFCENQRERKKEKERLIPHTLTHSLNDCNSWDSIRMKERMRNSIQVFPRGDRDPAFESSTCCPWRRTSAGSWRYQWGQDSDPRHPDKAGRLPKRLLNWNVWKVTQDTSLNVLPTFPVCSTQFFIHSNNLLQND